MQKYIKAAENAVKIMEAIILLIIIFQAVRCFEEWQRPKDFKKIVESVDTNTASV